MDDSLEQELKKQFEALPAELQQAISSVNLSEKLQEIVKNNKLMIDQASKLETETLIVLFGLEPLENFTNNLVENIGLSAIQASVITHDVNESIFKSVRESLKNIGDQMATTNKENSGAINTESTPEKVAINKTINPETQNFSSQSAVSNIQKPISLNFSGLQPQPNIPKPEIQAEAVKNGMELEIKPNDLPEISPEIPLPRTSTLTSKPVEPFHQNVPPVQNIVESKMTSDIIVPKKTINIEEKTKIPEKPKTSTSDDPYREPIM
jgi:hypothetical protein